MCLQPCMHKHEVDKFSYYFIKFIFSEKHNYTASHSSSVIAMPLFQILPDMGMRAFYLFLLNFSVTTT